MKVMIVKVVKMMNCPVPMWYVKVKETVSDEDREDQWGIRTLNNKSIASLDMTKAFDKSNRIAHFF